MAKKGTKSKIGVTDLAAAWRAGWSPADVNAILDRLDEIGDPNEPLSLSKEDQENPTVFNDSIQVDETPAEENVELVDEDDEDDEDEDVAAVQSNLNKLQQTALEVENKRLKDEIEKLQAANRRKDISGETSIKETPENALIKRFQSIF